MNEFGTHNYEDVSMENICTIHGISKGMMYHYFSNKDALFLFCVQNVFLQLKEYVMQEAAHIKGESPLESIRNYFLLRERFFRRNPMQKNIFENAMFRTPRHLKEEIQALRAPLREFNRQFFQQSVARLELRPSVGEEEANRYFESVEFVFWELLAQYNPKDSDFNINSLSTLAGRLLDMVLFGIARQKEEERMPLPTADGQ